MSALNTALLNIILRRNDFCCLCFKTYVEDAINFDDVVIINDDSLYVSEVLCCIFGDHFYKNLLTLDSVCSQCITSLINCYLFITMCKDNYSHLSNVIKSLRECFNNTTTELDSCKSLFVSLNTSDFTSTQHYDYVRSILTRSAVYKRFQTLTSETKCEMKLELDSNPVTEDINNKIIDTNEIVENTNMQEKTKCSKKNAKTCNILFDKNDVNIRCKECGKVCLSHIDLRKHFTRVHTPKTFKCTKCPGSYSSSVFLKQHINESHNTLVCSECGKMFRNKQRLKIHELSHRVCIVCQDCGRLYKTKDTYKKHIEFNVCQQATRKSTAEATYTCDACNKKYSRKHTLMVHWKFAHGDGKVHTCDWCNKRCVSKSKLKAHIVKHTQEKKFNCEICGGKYVTKESLLYHTRTHTGEKPYKCDHCEDRFLSSSRRTAHVKTHHTGGDLECDMCLSKFKSKACLFRHKKQHCDTESDVFNFLV